MNEDIKIAFDEDGKAHMLNDEYCIYCANEKTFNMVKEAVDKQKKKKTIHLDSVPHYRCPSCNNAVKIYEESPTYPIRYCTWCGQALDWDDTEFITKEEAERHL